MTEIINIPLVALDESPLNPRRHFAEAPLAELAESIRQVGVLTPLLVRPVGDHYEIAGGHRRYRAAKRAGLETVPCLVHELGDDEFLEIVTLDNLHREDVHPLDEANGFFTLLTRTNLEVEALAAKIGKSMSYIYQRLKLRDLVPAAQTAFLGGEITAGHALLLARLVPEDQKEFLDQCGEEEGGWTVADLRRAIHNQVYLRLDRSPFPTDDATLPGGSCVECPKRTGYNTQLFPDIAEADTCTDRECHAAKITAWLDGIYQAKKCTARVSARYGRSQEGCIQNWRPAGKSKCPDTRKALVVEWGYATGKQYKAGQVLTICANKKCVTHNPQAVEQRAAQKAHREERDTKREAEAQAKDAALARIVEAVRARQDVPDAAWRCLGLSIMQGQYTARVNAAQVLGIENEVSNAEEALTAHLEALTGRALSQTVLVILAVAIHNSYGTPEPIEQAFLDEYAPSAGEEVA